MPAPIFGPDQIDQSPNSVSLQTRPGNQFWSNYFAQGAQSVARPPVAYDSANADASRTWQMQMIQDLQRQAAGDTNSRAQQSLRQGYTDARAGQSAIGSATRGAGGGAGVRQGMQGAGSLQRGYAGDSAMLLNQEQTAAQSMLAQQLAAVRQTDAAQAQGVATNSMGNTSLQDAMDQFYNSQGLGMGLAEAQRGVDIARANAGITDAQRALDKEGRDAAMQAAGTTAGVASLWSGRGGGSGYRQVDGQNSIVPEWDK